MSSPPILDFDALTAPVDSERPTGEDLRADPSPVSFYYRIKDARSAARAHERSADDAEKANAIGKWREVLRLGPEILTARSKDLDITAWLIEALVRIHGFAGLRDGIRLAKELVERFWDGLYPMPDEDGVATRVAQLAGLNGGESEGTLMVPIALAPITGDGEFGPFSLWRYSKAREISKLDDPEAIEAALSHGGGTVDQFEATVRGTDPEFFRALAADIDETIEHFTALTAALDERCGHDSPASSNLRNTLLDAKKTVRHIVETVAGIVLEDGGGEDAGEARGEVQAATPRAREPSRTAATGEIHSREDAFRALGRVADYFRDTEPHSPLSSLLYQAVRWGRMPLGKLIEELIPDASARDHFGLLTGIRARSHNTDDGEAE